MGLRGYGHADVRLPSPLEEVNDEFLREHGVRLLLKRDDLISAEVPGNKWRKLHLNLQAAHEQGRSTLLTFGGAYSNHIRAVAAAGRACGFSTIGVIRGEEHLPLNWSLAYATEQGMRLEYLDRTTYRAKHTSEVIDGLRGRFGDFYLLPEGGSNALAVRGCATIADEIDEDFDAVCCACGTGGTLAGLAAGLSAGQEAIGFSVLKGGGFLNGEVRRFQEEAGVVTGNWSIETGYYFGGFAKYPPELAAFIREFQARHGVLLERIYVAKMLAGVYDLAARGRFRRGSTVVALVTGPPEDMDDQNTGGRASA